VARILSHDAARAFYDRFGVRQDRGAPGENRVIDHLVSRCDFESAEAVFEFGCGTAKLACRLLAEELPETTTYHAVDSSTTMVDIARRRLEPWGERARVDRTDGSVTLDAESGRYDRFIATYVFDLLSDDDTNALLAEAHRLLRPDGLLCVASLTRARGLAAQFPTQLWRLAHAANPRWVGGCRPILLARHVFFSGLWEPLYRRVMCPAGLCTEIIVARPAGDTPPDPVRAIQLLK
jgi:ubiquinone/menaquinone biosynthesis C-methylase UbiE